MYSGDRPVFPNNPRDSHSLFVKAIRPRGARPRNRSAERVILVCWGLIAVKSAVVWWACAHYTVPFSPWWVTAPTVGFAALGTAAYFYARR